MSDTKTPEIRLDFENVPQAQKVHDSWLSGKLHEMTMNSESGIKWETMGKDFKARLEDITHSSLHSVLAWQAAGIGEVAEKILPINSVRDLTPLVETMIRVSVFFTTIATTNFFSDLGEKVEKMSEKRKKEIQQRMTEVLKREVKPIK